MIEELRQKVADLESYIAQLEAKKPLLGITGYLDRHSELLAESTSGADAWNKLENELEQWFGIRRYHDYETFRQCRSYWIKNRHRKAGKRPTTSRHRK